MALTGNAETIAQFFSNKGLSAAGVAAILGTWQAESGLNPDITNSIGAHGLAQWLGSRRTELQALASRLGSTENSISVQLEFAWQELQGYPGLLHELQTTNDPEQAARDFVNQYERPGPGGDAGAPGYALTFFHGGVPGGAGNPSTPGTTTQPAGVFGPGPNNPYLQGLWSGLGTAIGGNPQNANNALSGIQGITQALIALVQDFAEFLNFLSLLTKPSTWLRIGAFLVGVVAFIGGFVMLKGSI